MTDPAPTDDPRIEGLLAHQRWVRALASRLVRGHDADDLAQEAWLATLTDLPDDDRPKRPWIAGVLRNLARMRTRGERRRSERESRARPWQSPPATPEEMASRLDTQRLLADLVAELPDPLRTTVLLRYFEDLSATEIARVQGIPAATVRTRLKRGLALLRGRLDARRGGERSAWCLAFLALETTPGQSNPPVATGSVLTLLSGALVMGLGTKIGISLAAVGILAAGAWLVTGAEADPVLPPDPGTAQHPGEGLSATAPRPRLREKRPLSREQAEGAASDVKEPAAPPKPAETERRLIVQVQDIEGAPLPVAQVLLLGAERVVAERASDETGSVEFDVPEDAERLLVAPVGVPPTVRDVLPGETELTVVVPPGLEVRGLLRVDGAQPEQPLRLWLSPPVPPLRPDAFSDQLRGALRGRGIWPERVGTVTDAEGRFSFRGLADAGAGLFLPPRGYAFAPGQGSADGSTASARIPAATATVRLERLPSARGRIVDAEGQPVPRARVLVEYVLKVGNTSILLREPTDTAEDGTFDALLPGRGHTSLRVRVMRADGGGTRTVHLPAELRPAMELGDVALATVRPVEIHVVDELDAPIAGAVALLRDGRWDFGEPTGEDGVATLQISSDGGKLVVGAPGYEEVEVELDAATEGKQRVTLRRAARIDVTIVTPDARALDGLVLEVVTGPDSYLSRNGRLPDTHASAGGATVRITSMDETQHRTLFDVRAQNPQTLWGLRSGQTVGLSVQDRLGNEYAKREVELTDAATCAVELPVQVRRRTISGHVFDADGAPVADALVRIHSPDSVSDLGASVASLVLRAHSNASGAFRFEGVFAPRVHLTATRAGHAPSEIVKLHAGSSATDLWLRAGRSVRVRVRDSDGHPIEAAIVDGVVRGYEPWTDSVMSGALWRGAPQGEGVYLLDDLPSGAHVVRVVAHGRTRTTPIAADAEEVDIVFPTKP